MSCLLLQSRRRRHLHTTGPHKPSPVLPTTLYRLNSTIQILLQILFVSETTFGKKYFVCLFHLGSYVSCLQLQSRHRHHLLTTGPQQPSPVVPTALCRLNSTIQILLQNFLFSRQNCEKNILFVCFILGSGSYAFCELPPIAIKTSPPLTYYWAVAPVARAAYRAMPVTAKLKLLLLH